MILHSSLAYSLSANEILRMLSFLFGLMFQPPVMFDHLSCFATNVVLLLSRLLRSGRFALAHICLYMSTLVPIASSLIDLQIHSVFQTTCSPTVDPYVSPFIR